jgi:hypothetical protein
MPRRARPPRLWLRPARRDKSGRVTHLESYVILDRGRQITVGSDARQAEAPLSRYIGEKHSSRIAHGKREIDQIPVADVPWKSMSSRVENDPIFALFGVLMWALIHKLGKSPGTLASRQPRTIAPSF